jgi:hypothetical protein
MNSTVMKTRFGLLVLTLLFTSEIVAAQSVSEQFLRYIYGAEDVDIAKVCLPTDDLWMLPGAKNTNAWKAITALKLDSKKENGILSGVIPQAQGQDLYFVELREGKVDPAMNLDGVYMMHRQLVLMFLYSALRGDSAQIARLTTDATKVDVIGPKAPPGDMDVYQEVLASMPIVRSSKPSDDAKSKSVSYRVPLSENALMLRLVKQGSTWKIDTSKTVKVSLEFFYR